MSSERAAADRRADGGTDADPTATPDPADDADARERPAYRGLFGAYPFAVRASDSWCFRAYAVLGGLLTALVALIVSFALVVLVARTAGVPGGSLTLSRAFYLVVLILLVAPLAAPVLLVARRHRRASSTRRYDAAMGAAGFLVVLSIYLAVLISAPPGQREAPPAAVAPVVDALYSLPPIAALAPPVIAAGLLVAAHRLLR